MLPPKPELEGPDCATVCFLPHQARHLSGWFCHVVMCPLEAELGPQRLPWRLRLLILRNSAVVPDSLLLRRTWAGEGGRNSAHLSDWEKAGAGLGLALLRRAQGRPS